MSHIQIQSFYTFAFSLPNYDLLTPLELLH
jgi:hypothetical protein